MDEEEEERRRRQTESFPPPQVMRGPSASAVSMDRDHSKSKLHIWQNNVNIFAEDQIAEKVSRYLATFTQAEDHERDPRETGKAGGPNVPSTSSFGNILPTAVGTYSDPHFSQASRTSSSAIVFPSVFGSDEDQQTAEAFFNVIRRMADENGRLKDENGRLRERNRELEGESRALKRIYDMVHLGTEGH